MSGIDKIPTKEASPEVSIEQYSVTDKESVIAGIADIQEVERAISDTRRPGSEMATEYFQHLTEEIAQKSGAIFVARSGSKVAGFIACWIEREEDVAKTPESNNYGYISDAWVSADLRSQGVFTKLNTKAEEHLKQSPDIHMIRINVLAENATALAAYEHTGYKPEEIQLVKRIEREPKTPE